jgi:hypothetical protein
MTFSICRTSLLIPAVAWFLVVGIVESAEPEPRLAANWRHIYYPEVPILSARGEKLSVLVGSDSQSERSKLRFDVLWNGLGGERPPDTIMNASQTRVRLHLRDGTVVGPSNRPEGALAGISMAGETSYSRTSVFPWGPNQLDEAWFELTVDDRVYWMEIPYGFTRDPAAPLAPAEPKSGAPALLPAMKKRRSQDRIIAWKKIDFDLGLIQQGWRLHFERVNSEEPRWIVIVYREDGPWRMSETSIHPKITEDGDGVLYAKSIETRVTDPFRFVTEFTIASSTAEGRTWGTLEISVDGNKKYAVIPSSLFKPRHSYVASYKSWLQKDLAKLTVVEARNAVATANTHEEFDSLMEAAVQAERLDLIATFFDYPSTRHQVSQYVSTKMPVSDLKDRVVILMLKSPGGWGPDPRIPHFGSRGVYPQTSDEPFGSVIKKLLPGRSFKYDDIQFKNLRLELAAELENAMTARPPAKR